MVLIDAHVHVHGCYTPSGFLNAAAANFRAAASALMLPADTPGVLLLTESAEADAFKLFREVPAGVSLDGWVVRATAEPGSLLVERPRSTPLVLVAGRQVATKEGLEVLALCTTSPFRERLSLSEAIRAAVAADAVVVLPWGFGKWLGRRGRLVAAELRRGDTPLFLGDNGGRAAVAPEPALFRVARQAGIAVLPGTDPLPFPEHEKRPGSYGVVAELVLDAQMPAQQLKSWLRGLRDQPRTYGARRPLVGFVRDQLRMQRRKRGGSVWSSSAD